MPIDPSIPLGATRAPRHSPLQTLGALAQYRGYQQLQEERQLQNEGRQRDLDDEDAIREVLSRTQNPDEAVDELYRMGNGTAASALSKNLYAERSAHADLLKKQIDNQRTTLATAAQLAQKANDQSSWGTARTGIVNLFNQDPVFKPLIEYLPQEYDKPRVDQLVAWGTDRKDQLTADQNAVENARKAIETQDAEAKDFEERKKNRLAAQDHWIAFGAAKFGSATSQQDWDGVTALMQQGGAAPETIGLFGNQFSPAAVSKARTRGLSANEQTMAADRAMDNKRQDDANAETKRFHDEELKRRDAANGGTGRGVTPNAQAQAERWKQAQYQRLEQQFRDGFIVKNNAKGDPEPDPEEFARQKLNVENSYRMQIGGRPVEETIQALNRQIKTEQDPARKRRLVVQLAKERDIYRNLTGK